MPNKNITLCVFAHPDDESFGPSGTIAHIASTGDVYILCLTRGDAQITEHDNLADVRSKELINSANILGVKGVFVLDYKDGTLSNNLYHKIGSDIRSLIEELKPFRLLTFDMTGVSGHLDHVAVSLITTYEFYKSSIPQEIWYFALDKQQRKAFGEDYFVYAPDGHDAKKISRSIDYTRFWDKKYNSMMAHKSQKEDADWVLNMLKKTAPVENFIIKKKVK